MSKQPHYRAIVRMWSKESTRTKRFQRVIDWMEKSAKTQQPHMVWTERGWVNSGGRGLIHKGRKP